MGELPRRLVQCNIDFKGSIKINKKEEEKKKKNNKEKEKVGKEKK
jgi:hypothetical protein